MDTSVESVLTILHVMDDVRPASQLNNHYQIYIQTHSPDKGQHQRVVGVLVWPTSVDSLAEGGPEPDCRATQPYVLQTESEGEHEVAFTYSVTFVDSPTVWATRWDPYFRLQGRVRFLSIANSLLIAAFCEYSGAGVALGSSAELMIPLRSRPQCSRWWA